MRTADFKRFYLRNTHTFTQTHTHTETHPTNDNAVDSALWSSTRTKGLRSTFPLQSSKPHFQIPKFIISHLLQSSLYFKASEEYLHKIYRLPTFSYKRKSNELKLQWMPFSSILYLTALPSAKGLVKAKISGAFRLHLSPAATNTHCSSTSSNTNLTNNLHNNVQSWTIQ
jgi:hypothetical protein